MDLAQIFVLIGGVLAIAFTLWFFFGARSSDSGSHEGDKVLTKNTKKE